MNEHLSPPGASDIEATLRIRLEGKVELLEDGVHLFESLTRALERPELRDDDVATLREVINQLPRLDQALDEGERASENAGPLGALVRLVRQKKTLAHDALNRLAGHHRLTLEPSLRAGLQQMVAWRAPPATGATCFLASQPPAVWPTAVAGLIVAGIGRAIAGHWHPVTLAVGGLVFLGLFISQRRTPSWALYADRLVIDGTTWWLRDVTKLERSFLSEDFLVVTAGERWVWLDGPGLEAWLSLLRAPLLAKLEPLPTGVLTQDADAITLTAPSGVLQLKREHERMLLKSLDAQQATLHQLCMALAHLPPARLDEVARHFMRSVPVEWRPTA